MLGLKGKSVLITGGASGIGLATAERFLEEEAEVVILDQDKDAIERLKKDLPSLSGFLIADVSDLQAVEKAFMELDEVFQDLNVLINNAGVFQLKPFREQELETIDKIIDTNLKGAMYCAHFTIPSMIKRKNGRIINVASVAGTWGMVGQAIYCASKHGLVGFGDALAQELKKYGVLLVTLCPGGIDTPLWRSKENPYPGDIDRLMKPGEIVDLIAFILDQPKGTLYKKIVFFPSSEWHAG